MHELGRTTYPALIRCWRFHHVLADRPEGAERQRPEVVFIAGDVRAGVEHVAAMEPLGVSLSKFPQTRSMVIALRAAFTSIPISASTALPAK